MGDEDNTQQNTNNDTENVVLTLDYVKNYLRIDHNYDDEFLNNCVKMSLLYARNKLGAKFDSVKYQADVKQALLYHIAQIYQNKIGDNQAPEASNEIYNMYKDIKIGI